MKHILFIGSMYPEPKSSAGGKRTLQLMKLFEDYGFKVSFATAAQETEFSEKLESYKINLNDSNFDIFIKELNPDIVVFDKYITEEQYGWRVYEALPNAIRILDTIDLHFLRYSREKNISLNNEITIREISSILRSDLSLIISNFEYELLVEQYKISNNTLSYLPIFIDNIIQSNFDEKKDLIFIGNFNHKPNFDAVLYLKKIWKVIRKNLNVNLNIFGSYPSKKVFDLKEAGFIIHGRAEDALNEIKKTKLLLAPLRFGAGLKGKILDAMSVGTPVVTTSVGAEGLFNLLDVVETEDQFIEQVINLYNNRESWEQHQKNNYQILNENFKRESFYNNFLDKINFLLNNKTLLREQNILNAIMLQNNQLAYKYLSKYIELKNN